MFESTKPWNYCDTSRFDNAKIGTVSMLPKYEKKVIKLFPGAWYRKVVSQDDYWLGIEGVITLGEFTPDEKRFNLDGLGRYMDVASIYMGGNAGEESDCGVGMNSTYPDADTSYDLKIDSPKLGYRPFYRYIYAYRETIGTTTNVVNVNSWNTANPKELNHVYFPGDTIRMRVYAPIPDFIQLKIELLEKTTIPKYVQIREKYNLKEDTDFTYYSPLMMSKGQGSHIGEYKRVNAIDQFGNEGKRSQNTDAKVSEATWHNCYLFKEINGELYKIPFTEDIYSYIMCPDKGAFTVKEYNSAEGGEKVSLHPETFRY